jgi:hypothetical protein
VSLDAPCSFFDYDISTLLLQLILAFALLSHERTLFNGDCMAIKNKSAKKNPLTKAQSELLRSSLKNLLGDGLLKDSVKKPEDVKEIVIKNAFNAILLNN